MSRPQSSLQRHVVSFWEAEFGDYVPNQPLSGDVDVDVVIIGGGYTGLTVAREFKKDAPGSGVAVLEAEYVGFGASGRNGGFSMSLFGLEPEVTRMRWGRERTQAAHDYAVRSIDYVRRLVEENDIDCDYQHSGMLRVAYSPRQVKRLASTIKLLKSFDTTGRYQFLEGTQLRDRVNTDRFQAAIFEPDTAIFNPIKHVRALKVLAEEAGTAVYEHSPVVSIERSGESVVVRTRSGVVRCKRLVIAVNAWSGQISGLPRIRSRQTAAWTAQVVTEPLPEAVWEKIGWGDNESIEDNRQMVHYLRRTVCGRITIGGGDVALPRDTAMKKMDTTRTWDDLQRHLRWMFPFLGDVAFEYRWGGPVSVNLDMTPEIGHIGDERVIYSVGCIGHGVSLTQLNGRLIADLLLERTTDLTEFWIVNRRAMPWPPGPIGVVPFNAIRSGLSLWDRFEERGLTK